MAYLLKKGCSTSLKEFDNVCIRRSTIASTGRIGLVPERAQEEDLISIFLGCSVPIILRPVGNHYALIGEAYIHGIMKGEVMEKLDKGNFKLQDFVMILYCLLVNSDINHICKHVGFMRDD